MASPVQESNARLLIPEELLPVQAHMTTLAELSFHDVSREAHQAWRERVRKPGGALSKVREALAESWKRDQESLLGDVNIIRRGTHALRTELGRLEGLSIVAEQIQQEKLDQLEPHIQKIVKTLLVRHGSENPELCAKALKKLGEELFEQKTIREKFIKEKELPPLLKAEAELIKKAIDLTQTYAFRTGAPEFCSTVAKDQHESLEPRSMHSLLQAVEEAVTRYQGELARAEPTILSPKVRQAVRELPELLQHLEQPGFKNTLHPCHRIALLLLLKNDPAPFGEELTPGEIQTAHTLGKEFVRQALAKQTLEEVEAALTKLMTNLFELNNTATETRHFPCSVTRPFADTFFQSARERLQDLCLLKEITGFSENTLLESAHRLSSSEIQNIHRQGTDRSLLTSIRAIFRVKPALLTSEPSELFTLVDALFEYRKQHHDFLLLKEFNPETNPKAFTSREAIARKSDELGKISASREEYGAIFGALAEAKLERYLSKQGVRTSVSITSGILEIVARSKSEDGELGSALVNRVRQQPPNMAVTAKNVRDTLDELERCRILQAHHRTPHRNPKTARYALNRTEELETLLSDLLETRSPEEHSVKKKNSEPPSPPTPILTEPTVTTRTEHDPELRNTARQIRNSVRGLERNLKDIQFSLDELPKLSDEVVKEWLNGIALIKKDQQHLKKGDVAKLSDQALEALQNGILSLRDKEPSEESTSAKPQKNPIVDRAAVIESFEELDVTDKQILISALESSIIGTLKRHCSDSTFLFSRIVQHHQGLRRIQRDRSSAFSALPTMKEDVLHRLSHDYPKLSFEFDEVATLLNGIPETRTALLERAEYMRAALKAQHNAGTALLSFLENPATELRATPEEMLRFCGTNIRLPQRILAELQQKSASATSDRVPPKGKAP